MQVWCAFLEILKYGERKDWPQKESKCGPRLGEMGSSVLWVQVDSAGHTVITQYVLMMVVVEFLERGKQA